MEARESVGYNFALNLVKKEDFGYRLIRSIKVSDAQQRIIKIRQDGRGYSTITSLSRSGAESVMIYAGNGPRTKI